MSAAYLRNHWYAVAQGAELTPRTSLSRQVLGDRLVVFRGEDGAAGVLRDRCSHRFAPLSAGKVVGNAVACPYHGMQFDAAGHCVRIPGQSRIPAQAHVESFPVIERYGLVFVWMGDPALASTESLIEIAEYADGRHTPSRGYLRFESCWENIADNLIDPAHTSFVHGATIGNDAGEDASVKARMVSDDTIECGRWIDDAPPVPLARRFTRLEGNVDRWQFYYLKAPSTSWVDFGVLPRGAPRTDEARATAPLRILSYAFLTPCTPTSTHYFSLQLRNFAIGDDAVTEELNAMYRATFEEDRVLLEAIQREEGENAGLKPMRIASDAGVTRFRDWLNTQPRG